MSTRMVNSDFSGHALTVSEITPDEMPNFENKDGYKQFYAVRNFSTEGVTFMYLGKGSPDAPREIVAWYAKHGGFWSSYGTTFKEAIEGAQRDGWMYA